MNEFDRMVNSLRSLVISEMKAQNRSLMWMSRKTGMAPATIYAYINGDRETRATTLLKILDAVGYSIQLVPK